VTNSYIRQRIRHYFLKISTSHDGQVRWSCHKRNIRYYLSYGIIEHSSILSISKAETLSFAMSGPRSLQPIAGGSDSSTSLPTQCPVTKQLLTSPSAVHSTSITISSAQLGTEISLAQKHLLPPRPSLSVGMHQVVMCPGKSRSPCEMVRRKISSN
jgi:hypothetical protein